MRLTPDHSTSTSTKTEANSELVDVSKLFREFGIQKRILALFNQHTYEVDQNVPRNNWLYPAFRGFQVLKERLDSENRKVLTFASIGTGSGLDGIYGQKVFGARRVILSDSHPTVIPLAYQNARDNIDEEIEILALTGNLCQPMQEAKLKADVLYANLPLIPDADVITGMRSSTYVRPDMLACTPEEYKKWLLGMKYVFLQNAWEVLEEHGSVVMSLGGRIPVALVQKMFAECGYSYEELFTMLKIQSQPEDVLPGFASAEKGSGIEFDFYDMTDMEESIQHAPLNMMADDFKEQLANHRLSATEALCQHLQSRKIGHIVQVMRGQRLSESLHKH